MTTPDIDSNDISYSGPAGDVNAYLARPAGDGPYPALLVIHEVFGLTPWVRDTTDRLAREGYVCLAPDLYTRDDVRKTLTIDDIERALEVMHSGDAEGALAAIPETERAEVQASMGWVQSAFTATTYVPDLVEGLNVLRGRDDVAKVGSIGWCMGGGVNGRLLASGADLDAGVIWYGPPPPFDQVGNIRCPVQGHYGGADALTEALPGIEKAFADAGRPFESFVYEGAGHAFGNDHRPSYDAAATALAWERTLAFFDRLLK